MKKISLKQALLWLIIAALSILLCIFILPPLLYLLAFCAVAIVLFYCLRIAGYLAILLLSYPAFYEGHWVLGSYIAAFSAIILYMLYRSKFFTFKHFFLPS